MTVTRQVAQKSLYIQVIDTRTGEITYVTFPEHVQVGTSLDPKSLVLTGLVSLTTRVIDVNSTLLSSNRTYNITNSDIIIGINCPGDGVPTNLVLPMSPKEGMLVLVKDSNGNARIDTIVVSPGSSGQTIDGELSSTLNTAYASAGFCWWKNMWHVVAATCNLVGYTSGSTLFNTALGVGAGDTVGTGTDDTCVGYNAGTSLSQGNFSTFIGAFAGETANTTNNNTFVGASAGRYSTGSNSSYFGAYAGYYNDAANNTAVGMEALRGSGTGLTSGHSNVAIGYQAGYTATSGYGNCLLGYQAGLALTTGIGNVAIGYQAGQSLVSTSTNTMLGTYAGQYSTGSQNSFFGLSAGSYIDGNGNIAFGHEALKGSASAATSATKNVAVGYQAGYAMTSGQQNVALGYQAGFAIKTGADNLCIGYNAGNGITEGTNNIVFGTNAGLEITDQGYNTYIGVNAARAATSGSGQTAIGYNAMYYPAGGKNVAIGQESMYGNVGTKTALGNNAIGYQSLYAVTSGQNNIALGYQAALAITSGGKNIIIGYTANGAAAVSNQISIGDTAVTSTANTGLISPSAATGPIVGGYFWIGNTVQQYTLQAQTITAFSDERIKKNIEALPYGLDFINGLRPRLYDLKTPSNPSSARKHMGFIAQELKVDVSELGLEGSIYTDDNTDSWGVDYNQFAAPLVRAVQELSSMVRSLQAEVIELKNTCRRR